MVQTDYTSGGQTPVVVNGIVGAPFYFTVHSGNLFGGHRGSIEDQDYLQGVVKGDQIFILERNVYSVHFLIGTYTRNGDEEKIEGIFYGYDDDETPGMSARVGEFTYTKHIAP